MFGAAHREVQYPPLDLLSVLTKQNSVLEIYRKVSFVKSIQPQFPSTIMKCTKMGLILPYLLYCDIPS